MYLNWISTASLITLKTTEGPKTCFNCIIGNTKLIHYRFIKSFVVQLSGISHSEKSIEHLKQNLSLDNN